MANDSELENTLLLLARTPIVLNALLRDLPETLTLRNEGDKTWSPFDVIVHLIQAEQSNWMPRVHMVLECGEAQAFSPFDRLPLVPVTQSMEELLDEFAGLRTHNLAALDDLHLSQEKLQRCGRHPAFGVVTLSQLLATWATHDLTHLHQISRLMAHQYREAVGPWSAYLGVLHCAGHSL